MADTRFILANVNARASATQIILPVMRGNRGIWYPTDNATMAVKNWKSGGGDGTVVGTPTYGDGYMVSSDQNNRITTGLAETLASTIFVVARSGAAFSSGTTRPIFGGIYRAQDSGFAGTNFRVTGTPSSAPAATVAFQAARDIAGVPGLSGPSITVDDFSEWTLFCGRVKDGAVTEARILNDLTNGVTGSSDAATGRTLATTSGGTNILTIGNCSSLQYGTHDCAAFIPFDVVLSDAEMEANAWAIREALAFDWDIDVLPNGL